MLWLCLEVLWRLLFGRIDPTIEIRDPWEKFIGGWNKIREILNSLEESKRIDLEEDMLDYIFRSVVRQAHQPSLIVI